MVTWERVGLEPREVSIFSSSLAMLLDPAGDFEAKPGLNMSSRGLTEGKVLWARSQPAPEDGTLAGAAGGPLMAAGATLTGAGVTLTGMGGGGAGGLGALCLVGLGGSSASVRRYDGRGFSPFSMDLIWLGVRDWKSDFSPSSLDLSKLIFQKEDSSSRRPDVSFELLVLGATLVSWLF